MCNIRIEMLDDETYTVEVCLMKEVPPDETQDGALVSPSHVSKEFSAADMDEVKALVEKYLPALCSHADEEGFDEAFNKAVEGKDTETSEDNDE